MEGVGIVPMFSFVPSVCGNYREAIVALFLYSSWLLRAQWAVMAVFFIGLSMHKTEAGTRQSCIARQQRSISRSSQCPLFRCLKN